MGSSSLSVFHLPRPELCQGVVLADRSQPSCRARPDNPVYVFMDKKRAEGKPYYVYMTAGANKFLRIYYGKVNAFLASKEKEEAAQIDAET